MRRNKSNPKDEIILTDINSDPIERSSSARKLLSDGYEKIVVPVLEEWLDHNEWSLRDDAVSLLLAGLGREKHFNRAVEFLHRDPNETVRASAARGITIFCAESIEGEKYEKQVIKELLLALIQDEDMFVQQNCYKGLLRIINKVEWSYYDEKYTFDRQTDIDWKMLQPFLDKFGLDKPTD